MENYTSAMVVSQFMTRDNYIEGLVVKIKTLHSHGLLNQLNENQEENDGVS